MSSAKRTSRSVDAAARTNIHGKAKSALLPLNEVSCHTPLSPPESKLECIVDWRPILQPDRLNGSVWQNIDDKIEQRGHPLLSRETAEKIHNCLAEELKPDSTPPAGGPKQIEHSVLHPVQVGRADVSQGTINWCTVEQPGLLNRSVWQKVENNMERRGHPLLSTEALSKIVMCLTDDLEIESASTGGCPKQLEQRILPHAQAVTADAAHRLLCRQGLACVQQLRWVIGRPVQPAIEGPFLKGSDADSLSSFADEAILEKQEDAILAFFEEGFKSIDRRLDDMKVSLDENRTKSAESGDEMQNSWHRFQDDADHLGAMPTVSETGNMILTLKDVALQGADLELLSAVGGHAASEVYLQVSQPPSHPPVFNMAPSEASEEIDADGSSHSPVVIRGASEVSKEVVQAEVKEQDSKQKAIVDEDSLETLLALLSSADGFEDKITDVSGLRRYMPVCGSELLLQQLFTQVGPAALLKSRVQTTLNITAFHRKAETLAKTMRVGIEAAKSVVKSAALQVLLTAIQLLGNCTTSSICDSDPAHGVKLESVARVVQMQTRASQKETSAFHLLVRQLQETQKQSWLFRLISDLEVCRTVRDLDCTGLSSGVSTLADQLSGVQHLLCSPAHFGDDGPPALRPTRLKQFTSHASPRVLMLQGLEEQLKSATSAMRNHLAEPANSTLSYMMHCLASLLDVLPTPGELVSSGESLQRLREAAAQRKCASLDELPSMACQSLDSSEVSSHGGSFDTMPSMKSQSFEYLEVDCKGPSSAPGAPSAASTALPSAESSLNELPPMPSQALFGELPLRLSQIARSFGMDSKLASSATSFVSTPASPNSSFGSNNCA